MRHKLLLLLIIIALKSNLAVAQSADVRSLLDTTISIMRDNAVNAGKVNWDTLKQHAFIKAANVQSPYQLGPVIRYLYQSLNDFHGSFFYRDSVFRWIREAQPPVSDSIMNEWKKGVKSKTEVLDDNIGYLRVPSMPGASKMDFDRKAKVLSDSLCLLLTKGIKGLILDLRLNGGGAMHPMILGLEPLLPQGHTGSFRVKGDEDWILKDHAFLVDTVILTSILPKCEINSQNLPIAIVTGVETGSSGEFLVMAFKGRDKTIIMGSKTKGYVTINNGFQINEMTSMNLSVGYGADRNGKVYTEALDPDIILTGVDKFNDIKNDEKVKAALRWLKSHNN